MLALIIIVLVVILDQVSKYLALTLLQPIGSYPIIDQVLEFNFVLNRGAAWGILENHRWIFITVSCITIVAILIYLFFSKSINNVYKISLALVVGGGIGNMIDRLFYEQGAVVDFIYFKLIDFPVFNIADSAVTIGAVMLISYIVIFEILKPSFTKKTTQIEEQENADTKTDLQ